MQTEHSRVCTNCKEKKAINEFGKSIHSKNGIATYCKTCLTTKVKEYQRTKKGLITRIYYDQKKSCKNRNMENPTYTKFELIDWFDNNDMFDLLYCNWVKSNYNTKLSPSVDRIDDYKSYTFDNIRLVTWQDNFDKYSKDKKEGLNRKTLKAVISYNKNNEETTEYYSAAEASRQTGLYRTNIIKCCKGRAKTAGGFKWRYKDIKVIEK